MDYEQGLAALKAGLAAAHPNLLAEFAVLEERLLDTARRERLFGGSEATRSERSQVVYELNGLALQKLGVSFNDLCAGAALPVGLVQPPAPHEVPGALPAGPAKGDGSERPADKGVPPVIGTGRRWGVLVGVNEYDDWNYGRLRVCVQDVTAIRGRLAAGGYDPQRLRLLTDETPADLPTRANILTALEAVARATGPDDLLLFYYSGHGDEVEDESYLVARDGRRVSLRRTGVSLADIRDIVLTAPAQAKVIILDACHSGVDLAVGKGPRPMTPEFIRRVFMQARGLAVLASCEQGQLSYEWQEEGRSVFTHYLLEALTGAADREEKGFVTVQDANRHVVDGVNVWAAQHNAVQTPTLEYRVSGDIILAHYAREP